MTSEDAMYIYPPLPSHTYTRFVDLFPSTDPSAPLRCQLNLADLAKDVAPYDALSYTWGSGVFSDVLHVQDTDGCAVIPITENLSAALCNFRHRSKHRIIWVDAVCISQRDDEEKSIQLPSMVDIYRGATKVVVWLGSEPECETAMARIGVLGRRTLLPSTALSTEEWGELAACACILLTRPWFTRRWIIQEVVFNMDVVLFCGGQSLGFHRLAAVLSSLSTSSVPRASLDSCLAMHSLWKNKMCGNASEDCGLLRLMRVFEGFGCVEAKDHVFTIASLAQDVELGRSGDQQISLLIPSTDPYVTNKKIYLDYAATAEETFLRFAEFIGDSGHLIWVLAQASARASDDATELPSWVPDWRIREKRRPIWMDIKESTWPTENWGVFMEENCEGILKQYYDDAGLFRVDCPTRPAIVKAGIGHRLRAPLCHLEHWPSDLETLLPKVAKVRTMATPLQHDMVFPLAVDWTTDPFPASDNQVIDWIKSSFLSLLERVLPPSEYAAFGAGSGDQRWTTEISPQHLPGRYLERFTFCITAGGMFIDHIDDSDRKGLAALKDTYPSYIHQTKFSWDNFDIESNHSASFCRHYQYNSLSCMTVILQCVIDGKMQDHSGREDVDIGPLLRLISVTMRGRSVMTCDYHGSNPPEAAGPLVVLGIGPPHTRDGDRIMSFFRVQKSLQNRGPYAWVSSPETLDATSWARLNLSSDGSTCLDSDKMQAYWTHTYIVRDQNNSKRPGPVQRKEWTEDNMPDESLSQDSFEVPSFKFIGDCFLTTARWAPNTDGVGFCGRSWGTDDKWAKLAWTMPMGDEDFDSSPRYKKVNSAASVLEVCLV